MKVTSYAVARPAFYDRNAASFGGGYAAVVAPHATTTRISVTVASGKKVILEGVNASVNRQTVATVAGLVNLYANITSVAGFRLVDIATTNNIALVRERQFVVVAATIYAGEIFDVYTEDPSTGGTVQYIVQYKGTTFDA